MIQQAAAPTTTEPLMSFVGLVESAQFKYVLNEVANSSCNPKQRRRLIREIRDAIKACADAQRRATVAQFASCDLVLVSERLPAPYEEVRIMFDGVPRIARLAHNREYFQLATFIDSTKSQYIATFDRVAGWMPLPVAMTANAERAA